MTTEALVRVLVLTAAPPSCREEVWAEFDEEHALLVAERGPETARRWLARQGLRSLPALLAWRLRRADHADARLLVSIWIPGFVTALLVTALLVVHDFVRGWVPLRDGVQVGGSDAFVLALVGSAAFAAATLGIRREDSQHAGARALTSAAVAIGLTRLVLPVSRAELPPVFAVTFTTLLLAAAAICWRPRAGKNS